MKKIALTLSIFFVCEMSIMAQPSAFVDLVNKLPFISAVFTTTVGFAGAAVFLNGKLISALRWDETTPNWWKRASVWAIALVLAGFGFWLKLGIFNVEIGQAVGVYIMLAFGSSGLWTYYPEKLGSKKK